MRNKAFLHQLLSGKALVFVLMLAPLATLLWATVFDQLGANPAQTLVRSTGDWTLRLLCVVLAVTPLRVLFKQPKWAAWRRMLGLFVFFYATLHMLAYSGFDMGFDVVDIGRDIAKRPFILVGFCAFLVLGVLALTSFKRAIQLLGGKNWQRLHATVYGVAMLAILHFFWMRSAKNDFSDVMLYTAIMALLLGWRLVRWLLTWVPRWHAERQLQDLEDTAGPAVRTRPK